MISDFNFDINFKSINRRICVLFLLPEHFVLSCEQLVFRDTKGFLSLVYAKRTISFHSYTYSTRNSRIFLVGQIADFRDPKRKDSLCSFICYNYYRSDLTTYTLPQLRSTSKLLTTDRQTASRAKKIMTIISYKAHVGA